MKSELSGSEDKQYKLQKQVKGLEGQLREIEETFNQQQTETDKLSQKLTESDKDNGQMRVEIKRLLR